MYLFSYPRLHYVIAENTHFFLLRPKKIKIRMILSIAIDMLQGLEHGKTTFERNDKVFRSHFGTSSTVSEAMWTKLVENGLLHRHPRAKKKHLLWAQLLLFVYLTTPVASTICGVSEKTFSKWAWTLIKELEQVMDKLVSMEYIFSLNSNYCIQLLIYFYRFSLKTGKRLISAMTAF